MSDRWEVPESWAAFVAALPEGSGVREAMGRCWQDSPGLRVLWARYMMGVRFAREMERLRIFHAMGARRILKKHGLGECAGNPHRGFAPHEKENVVIELRNRGMKSTEIAESTGIPRRTVRGILQRARYKEKKMPKASGLGLPWDFDDCSD